LNPKFKDISQIVLLLYTYSNYDYRVIIFMSKSVYILLGHSVLKSFLHWTIFRISAVTAEYMRSCTRDVSMQSARAY
jgi:hypothetical protein